MVAVAAGGLASTPPWPPQGGAGDGYAAIVNGWVYAVVMRTSALRVTIGAYSDTTWHVSIIQDIYQRGVLVDSVMWWGPMYCGWDRVVGLVEEAALRLRELELERLKLPATG
jgi:hypothetical protein